MFSLASIRSSNVDDAVKLKVFDQFFFSVAEFVSDETKEAFVRMRELTTPFLKRCWTWWDRWILQQDVYTRLPLTSAGTASRGTMAECVAGLASKIAFSIWVGRASGRWTLTCRSEIQRGSKQDILAV